MQLGAQGPVPVAEFETKDGVYDCAWCEVHPLPATHEHNADWIEDVTAECPCLRACMHCA